MRAAAEGKVRHQVKASDAWTAREAGAGEAAPRDPDRVALLVIAFQISANALRVNRNLRGMPRPSLWESLDDNRFSNDAGAPALIGIGPETAGSSKFRSRSMIRTIKLAALLALSTLPLSALLPVAAAAQAPPMAVINGTRLDVVATGEVSRVPDIARITAGVITTAPTATAALEQNARQMSSVRQALRQAGIADRDIQTSSINLYPDYRQDQSGTNPQLIGYRASNEVTIRFRDIKATGKILDALVAQGANQINGPMLGIDKPEQALDEARVAAIAAARSRAELYARATGKRVGRILSISESGGGAMPMARMVASMASSRDSTSIEPGEQSVAVTLSVSFELE